MKTVAGQYIKANLILSGCPYCRSSREYLRFEGTSFWVQCHDCGRVGGTAGYEREAIWNWVTGQLVKVMATA
jgi:hypothetical protein